MSNRPHRRREGHLPIESDGSPRRRGGVLGWLFGSGSENPSAPVVVATISSRPEAELLAGFLRDKGIHAIVSADDEAGLSPNLATLGRVRVLVQQRDADRAKKLVAETDAL